MSELRFLLLLGAAGAAIALASGCASQPPLQIPKEVKVPTPVPCVQPKQLPEKPVVRTEADLMAMDRYRRTLAAWSDLKKLEIYSAALAVIAEACSRIPQERPP